MHPSHPRSVKLSPFPFVAVEETPDGPRMAQPGPAARRPPLVPRPIGPRPLGLRPALSLR